MNEHPILFGASMVRAILDGRKHVTRRVVKPQATRYRGDALGQPFLYAVEPSGYADPKPILCPYGVSGDLLWVRETWAEVPTACGGSDIVFAADYRDGSDRAAGVSYKPSIHMPRWASRLRLRVTDVRVERLQDISDEDAIAEGCEGVGCTHSASDWPGACTDCMNTGWLEPPTLHFRYLWDSINAKPRPQKTDGVITHYRAYPWDESHPVCQQTMYKGKPLICYPNPWVWVVRFERAPAPHEEQDGR